jgi:hypothetical protein
MSVDAFGRPPALPSAARRLEASQFVDSDLASVYTCSTTLDAQRPERHPETTEVGDDCLVGLRHLEEVASGDVGLASRD